MGNDLKVFSGNSNRSLALEICRYLGISLSNLHISRFSNDNMFIQVKENVREKDVLVIQSFTQPLSDNIMELMITLDAMCSHVPNKGKQMVRYYVFFSNVLR